MPLLCTMLKCIIIDDEPQAGVLLSEIIKIYTPELTISATCDDLPSGVKAIKKYKPDLVFLDIEMPGYSGLELLDFFNEDEVDFGIIFTTAYNQYAVSAFKLSAIDYLLKPIQHTQLQDALQRFIGQQNKQKLASFKALQSNITSGDTWQNKRIAIPTGQAVNFYKPSDIVMIKGEAAYSEIYLHNNQKLLASRNLRHFEELLKDIPVFYRSHKSYIINTQAVQQYIKSDGGYLQLSNNLQASISADKVDSLLGMLK
jgi:two-component system, LytTR family, response regulator